MAFVAAAGYPPSPIPKRKRMRINEVKDHARPDNAVNIDQATTAATMTFRDPKRSASQPPGICMNAYPTKKALRTIPNFEASSVKSSPICTMARLITVLSMYDIIHPK